MKRNNLSALLLLGLVFLISCGKPTDPESIKKEDNSAGYKVISTLPTAGFSQDIVKQDNLVYIAQGEGGLTIIDVSNKTNIS